LAILNDYLDLQCSIGDLATCLSEFESRHGLELGKAKEALLETCNQIEDMLSKQGREGDVAFKADFGRRLDYYSGFNFELRLEGEAKPVAGGGRYDRLLGLLAEKQDLGATVHAVPAVGFSIWLGRVQA
jgi:ATP phosphoribosyltransferase regulatory subunit